MTKDIECCCSYAIVLQVKVGCAGLIELYATERDIYGKDRSMSITLTEKGAEQLHNELSAYLNSKEVDPDEDFFRTW